MAKARHGWMTGTAIGRSLVVLCLLMAFAPGAWGESETVQFPMTEFSGETTVLSAALTRPAGEGPFPAVVLLNGCGGTYPTVAWAERFFGALGYVALRIDSYGPRGIDGVCREHRAIASPAIRARDAHAGKTFLEDLPFVDPDAIAVAGWSHGGSAVLAAVESIKSAQPDRQRPFAAAIAIYPGCAPSMLELDSPLLIMIGDADIWTPADRCIAMRMPREPDHEYGLVIYPGASHGFDLEELLDGPPIQGMTYDPIAAEDAYDRMTAFLEKYAGG